jgi:pyruvate/2-oxoglutarate dehydrogenase complex dihydrolipoamide dehydrogenase (E3) component
MAGGKVPEASLAVIAIGWAANTAGLDLARAGVETDKRDFVRRRVPKNVSASTSLLPAMSPEE